MESSDHFAITSTDVNIGPGIYNIQKDIYSQKPCQAKAVFSSKVPRFGF